MKVLMIEPGKTPYEAEIESGLNSLQAAVGGIIQPVYPYEDPVALICNDEGKLMGLPLNRALYDEDGNIYDIVAGNFLIVGLGRKILQPFPQTSWRNTGSSLNTRSSLSALPEKS